MEKNKSPTPLLNYMKSFNLASFVSLWYMFLCDTAALLMTSQQVSASLGGSGLSPSHLFNTLDHLLQPAVQPD